MFHSDFESHSIFRFGNTSLYFFSIVSMSNSHSLYDCLCTTDIGDRIVKAKVLVVGAGGIGCADSEKFGHIRIPNARILVCVDI